MTQKEGMQTSGGGDGEERGSLGGGDVEGGGVVEWGDVNKGDSWVVVTGDGKGEGSRWLVVMSRMGGVVVGWW